MQQELWKLANVIAPDKIQKFSGFGIDFSGESAKMIISGVGE